MRRNPKNSVNRQAGIGPETFRFFRELGRNNSKAWMDANRERYKSAVVEPMRGLLADLTPAALKLYPGFDVCGRTGVNFSRINRDIRFAKDKTPYRPQMYLVFPDSGKNGPDGGKTGPDERNAEPNGATFGLSAERGVQEGFLPPQHAQHRRVLRTPDARRAEVGRKSGRRRARNDNASGERAPGGGMTTLEGAARRAWNDNVSGERARG